MLYVTPHPYQLYSRFEWLQGAFPDNAEQEAFWVWPSTWMLNILMLIKREAKAEGERAWERAQGSMRCRHEHAGKHTNDGHMWRVVVLGSMNVKLITYANTPPTWDAMAPPEWRKEINKNNNIKDSLPTQLSGSLCIPHHRHVRSHHLHRTWQNGLLQQNMSWMRTYEES